MPSWLVNLPKLKSPHAGSHCLNESRSSGLVRSGMARAKAKGTKSGNAIGRPAVTAGIEDQIRMLRTQGLEMIKIARQAGCGVSVVQRVIATATL